MKLPTIAPNLSLSAPQEAGVPAKLRGSGIPVLLGLICAILWGIPLLNAHAKATFEWDPNPQSEVAGYHLYYGTASGDYTEVIDAGRATSVTIERMFSGVTYYVAVTAYDSRGMESEASNEVELAVPPPWNLTVEQLTQAQVRELIPDYKPSEEVMAHLLDGSDGKMSFLVTGASQKGLTIYASSNLRSWRSLGSVANQTGAVRITEILGLTVDRLFYRAEQVDIDVTLKK